MRFAFSHAQKAQFPVQMMCQRLEVSRSGYYAWCHRSPSRHQQQDPALSEQIQRIHHTSRGTCFPSSHRLARPANSFLREPVAACSFWKPQMEFLDGAYCSLRTARSVEKRSLDFPPRSHRDGPALETWRAAALSFLPTLMPGGAA